MTVYLLSGKADADVEAIVRDSLARWGLARTEAYVLGLHDAFQRLAEFPELGRDASDIRPGLLRFDTASHAIFYRVEDHDILILRVLHGRMDVRRHI